MTLKELSLASVESQYGMVTEDFFVLNASSNLKYSIT
jgi:hypothetical protein